MLDNGPLKSILDQGWRRKIKGTLCRYLLVVSSVESEANDGLLVLAGKVESSVRLFVDNEVGLS